MRDPNPCAVCLAVPPLPGTRPSSAPSPRSNAAPGAGSHPSARTNRRPVTDGPFLFSFFHPAFECRLFCAGSICHTPVRRYFAKLPMSSSVQPSRIQIQIKIRFVSLTIRFVSLTMLRKSTRNQSSAKRKASPDEPAEASASKAILRSRVSYL